MGMHADYGNGDNHGDEHGSVTHASHDNKHGIPPPAMRRCALVGVPLLLLWRCQASVALSV